MEAGHPQHNAKPARPSPLLQLSRPVPLVVSRCGTAVAVPVPPHQVLHTSAAGGVPNGRTEPPYKFSTRQPPGAETTKSKATFPHKTPVPSQTHPTPPQPPARLVRYRYVVLPARKTKNVHHHHRPPRQLRACACTGATEPAALLVVVGMGAAAVDDAASMRAAVRRLSFGAAAEERRDAAGEVARLARADERTKRLLPELGVVPPLLDMLVEADAQGAAGARVAAARALLELARGTHRLVVTEFYFSVLVACLPACLGVQCSFLQILLACNLFLRAMCPCYYY